MVSRIQICNRALSGIGTRSQIVQLQENSPEAKQCLLIYDTTRTSLLQAAHWDFARKTAYLTLLKALPGTPENQSVVTSDSWDPATMPAPPWLYSYAYPADCIQFRYISPQIYVGGALPGGLPIFSTPTNIPNPEITLQPQHFEVAIDNNLQGQPAKVVLTNQSQAIGIYTADIEPPDLWSSLFQDAMVDSLAAQLAMALTGNLTLARSKAQSALGTLTQARTRDGNEGLTVNDHIPDWMRVRGYNGDWSTVPYTWSGWVTPSFLLI